MGELYLFRCINYTQVLAEDLLFDESFFNYDLSINAYVYEDRDKLYDIVRYGPKNVNEYADAIFKIVEKNRVY